MGAVNQKIKYLVTKDIRIPVTGSECDQRFIMVRESVGVGFAGFVPKISGGNVFNCFVSFYFVECL